MYQALDDTIVAVSSAAGHGPRGIVRLSGGRALEVAEALFHDGDARPLRTRGGFRRFRGEAVVEHDLVVPAELYLFLAPRSFTRQDLVELHTVGSPALLAMLVERALERGARLAEAGEFTARAFFNGALGLAEAESVAAVIRAQSDAQLRCAHRLREGTLGRRAAEWMERLAEVTALVEADIDFAEEPIEFITPAELRARLAALRAEMDGLLRDSNHAERFDVLPTVLLIGPANAGKSSLMNALSGVDRAICSAVAGTTRDILSAPLSLPGLDCLLLDGAGLSHSEDDLIQAAQAMTEATASRVDLLCWVSDLSKRGHPTFLEGPLKNQNVPFFSVANKADLVTAAEAEAGRQWIEEQGRGPVVVTSAVSGEGLTEAKQMIRDLLGDRAEAGDGQAVLLTVRHRQALTAASEALERAISEAAGIAETIDRADVIALELREALDAVGSLSGGVTTEEILGRVFASFCIGK